MRSSLKTIGYQSVAQPLPPLISLLDIRFIGEESERNEAYHFPVFGNWNESTRTGAVRYWCAILLCQP